DRFRVQGYPTLVFLNPQGQEIRRSGYQPGGAQPFVQSLAKLTGVAPVPPAPAAAAAAAIHPRTPPGPVQELPLFGGAPTTPPPRYTNFVLKSISGPKERRFALLNNQTLTAGETARVRLENS